MGTDIHMEVEARIEGMWKVVDAPESYARDEFHIERFAEAEAEYKATGQKCWDFDYYQNQLKKGWYTGRNYCAFAVLGNVRNGFGFAGTVTHKPITPISDRRGLPQDIDDQRLQNYLEESEHLDEGWYGDHSFSWVGLDELMAYDWEYQMDARGIVPRAAYEALRAGGWNHRTSPQSHKSWPKGEWMSSGISGSDVHVQNESVPGEYITDKMRPETTHIDLDYTDTVATRCGEYYNMRLSMCELVPEGGSLKDVRLVFGFDS